MTGHGTFVPAHFVPNRPTKDELAAASVVWGISLALTAFAIIRCAGQTYAQWVRIRKVNLYMVLIWLELISSALIGGMAYGYVEDMLPPSLWFFGGTILLWVFQVHCILQIIINRIALIAYNETLVKRLKWGVFGFVMLINIVVANIWIPAQLQISERYIAINKVWDRSEKVILAMLDVSLNLYFIFLVRSSLIEYGLTRYVRLYRVNIGMICVSLTMDILLIAMMSLQNEYFYVFFHPLAYLVKLHIELSMAELIAKIVKASSIRNKCACTCHTKDDTPAPTDFAPTTGRISAIPTVRRLRERHVGLTATAPSTRKAAQSNLEEAQQQQQQRQRRGHLPRDDVVVAVEELNRVEHGPNLTGLCWKSSSMARYPSPPPFMSSAEIGEEHSPIECPCEAKVA